MGRLPLLLLAAAVLLAGCGGGSDAKDPAAQVPADGGVRAKVRAAQAVTAGDFPAAGGRTLQQVADSAGTAGPELGLASSVFTVGEDRVAFGVIDDRSGFVYGKTALYVARTPDKPAAGPYPAPADVLVTQGRYRSKQAATEADPFAAVYAAQVPFKRAGKLLDPRGDAGRRQERRRTGPDQGDRSRATTASPPSASARPKVETDTLGSARGDVASIDTRVPPSDMHAKSFADVVGRKPVALLFATPQLCQSRVCGPVTDVALQLKAKYGDRVEFIHQEVYADNDPNKGPARAAAALQPADGALAVHRRARRQDHGTAGGVLRARRLRAGAEDRPVITVFAHGLVQRSSLPIPEWLFGWAAAIVLCVSFVALAALWPRPRLEDPSWRPLPGGLRARQPRAGDPRRRDRRRDARARARRRLRRPADAAGQLRADLRLHHLLGRAGVRERAARRRLPPLQPVAGDRPRAVPRPRAPALPRSGSGAGPPPPGCSLFTWIELASGWGEQPATLASAVAGYSVLTLAAMAVYGVEPWARWGETFSVYFNLFARMSVFETRDRVVGVRPFLGGLPRLDPVAGTVALVVRDDRHRHVRRAEPGPALADLAVELNDGLSIARRRRSRRRRRSSPRSGC